MSILSFIGKMGNYKPRIILQARDSNYISPEETQNLAELIRTINFEYKVDVAASPEQIGKGIILTEILYIWLITGSSIFVYKFAGKFGEKLVEEVAKIVIQWARDRFKKEGKTRFPTKIFIYGPNGKILKSVVVKDAAQEVEDQTERDREEQRRLRIKRKKPPLLKE